MDAAYANAKHHAWLIQRRTGLGASDSPNILGVGYSSPQRVYRSKIDPPAETERPKSGVLARGHALEPTVAVMYAEALGLDAPRYPDPYAIVRHPELDYLFCTPDWYEPGIRQVQFKTTAGFGVEWGEPGGDDIPYSYAVQVQKEMLCTGMEVCDLAALDVIAWELRVYRVHARKDFQEWLVDVETEFWLSHVVPQIPPGSEWEQKYQIETEARLAPAGRLILGEDVAALCEKRRKIGEVRSEANKLYDGLTAQIRAAVGGAAEAVAPGWTITQRPRKGYTSVVEPGFTLNIKENK